MDTDSPSLLIQAVSAGRLDELERLLGTEQRPTEEAIHSLLAAAARESQSSIVTFLLSKYPAIPINEAVIRAATFSGSTDVVSALVSKDPSIANCHFENGGTPLTLACLSQKPVEFLECLLKAGADPNLAPDVTPLPLFSAARLYKDPDVIELLLKYGAKLERSGALGAAALQGNKAIVQCLIEHGAEQEADCEPGGSELAVHAAARRRHVGVLRILLEHGAKCDVKDSEGRTVADIINEVETKEGKDLNEMRALLVRYQ
ncbi:ankyrin repeat-containing domain protein [Hypoxylon crocopeplum]|nr:ankyrin repeat-containing domain protein [Hypoxylon crocopeplum]